MWNASLRRGTRLHAITRPHPRPVSTAFPGARAPSAPPPSRSTPVKEAAPTLRSCVDALAQVMDARTDFGAHRGLSSSGPGQGCDRRRSLPAKLAWAGGDHRRRRRRFGAFSPACSASAAVRSSCRSSTRCSASSAWAERSADATLQSEPSLAIIVPTTIRFLPGASRRAGAVMAGCAAHLDAADGGRRPGSASGARRLRAASRVFKIVFVILAAIIAAPAAVRAADRWRLGDELPGKAGMVAYGLGIGPCGLTDGGERRPRCRPMVLTLYGQVDPTRRSATAAGLGVPLTIRGQPSAI